MNRPLLYLDYNATAPVRPEAVAAMAEVLAIPSNPSSVHGYGRAARKRLEDARALLAETVSCFPGEVIFTGSGTEANNTVLRAFAGLEIMVSAVEHASVLKPAPHAVRIPVTPDGVIDLDTLREMLKGSSGPALISVMLANNETGAVQPVRELVELVRPYGTKVHCDAVQALGKMPVDIGVLGVDMMTLAAHKMGGPPGAAALVVRQGTALPPLLAGGGQESNRRAGTQNLAAIAGWAKALELVREDQWQQPLRSALDALEARLAEAAPGMQVLGKAAPRLPNTSAIRMPGVPAETQLMHFDLSGIAVSAGSACSSGRIEASHVVRAMGLDEAAAGEVVRVSGGWGTQPAELEAFAESWLTLWKRVGKAS